MCWLRKQRSIVLLAALAGCQDQSASVPPSATPVTSETATAVNAGVTEVAASDRAADPAAPAPKQPPEATAQVETPFEPPFGNRVELFVPPQQDVTPVERAPRSEESAPEVVLKGFVNVGAPKVVLLIDGAVSALGEGQEKHGIRIVALAPPQVTLERGRRRWTLSLAKAESAAARVPRERVPGLEAALSEAPDTSQGESEAPPTEDDGHPADE